MDDTNLRDMEKIEVELHGSRLFGSNVIVRVTLRLIRAG